MSTRLVIADDHSMVLQGLRALLAMEPDLDVVALCTDGVEAVEAIETHRPDVLVMDAEMPRRNGLATYQLLREKGLHVPTVIVAATVDDDTLRGLMGAAVEGLVLKEAAPAELVEAIRRVAGGGKWIGPELTARALDLMAAPIVARTSGLTPREKEVVLHVAEGKSNRRVASQMGIAESTVKLHLHSAFTKLEVSNRTQLSLLARERGWID